MDFCEKCQELLPVLANLRIDTISNDERHIAQLHEKLIWLKDALKYKENRDNLQEKVITELCSQFIQLLEQTKEILDATQSSIDARKYYILDLATENVRCLRNACAGCGRNQEIMARQSRLYERLQDTIEACCLFVNGSHLDNDKHIVYLLLRCCIQMLGNLASANKQAGLVIWKNFFKLFSKCLALGDAPLSSYSCMLIHSCYLADPAVCSDQLVDTASGQQLVNDILGYMTQHDSEWGLFIIEWLLMNPRLLDKIWNQLETKRKNLLLDLILSQLDKGSYCTEVTEQANVPEHKDVNVAKENIHFILKSFKENPYTILGLHQNISLKSEDSLLVNKQLSILCAVTTVRDKYADLIQDEDLLKCAINLLHCMKQIGDEGDNAFSPISKVSELEKTDTSHPVCGLKRDLVRLIANMVYKNKVNQDKVRELGGISLIMDHTNIDGRNPFITQWSIFAIHNLLESNPENQAVVSGLRLEGLSDNVQQLREFGVEAELDGDRVIVRNVNMNESVSPLSKFYKEER